MTVPAAGRVLDLIEAFAKARRPMTITGIAKMLGLPPSSCHGLVKTLEDRGYLIKLAEPAGYYFSKRLEEHALRIAGYNPLPTWVLPALEELRDAADETTLLAKFSGSNAVYVEVLESAQSVRYIAQVGDLRPLHASAAGKALLGSVPAEERAGLLEEIELVKRNPQTIADRKALLRDLEASAERGWYMTKGEFLPDVTAVAAPLRLAGEAYAVVVAGPSARMEAKLQQHIGLVTSFATLEAAAA
jgi:IclR family transcriptional regulator, acetate operon repressor